MMEIRSMGKGEQDGRHKDERGHERNDKDIRPGRGGSTSNQRRQYQDEGSVQREHIRQKKTRLQGMRRAGSQGTGRIALERAGDRLQEMGKKETRDTVQRFTVRSKNEAARRAKHTGRAAAKKTVKVVRPSRSIQVKNMHSARKKMFVRKRQQAMMQRNSTVKTVKIAFVNTVRAVKLAASGMKVLVSAIIAGGWVSVVVIIICCLLRSTLS